MPTLFLATLSLLVPSPQQATAELPPSAQQPQAVATGPEFVDMWMHSLMARHEIPGASLAIVKDGELLYSRGFGFADRERTQRVQPNSRFRIASISKPITAVAILKLIEEDRFGLDDLLVDLLPLEKKFGRPAADERWKKITVRHLLQHRAGWKRDGGYDPMFVQPRIRVALQLDENPTAWQIMEYMWQQPLDTDPGSAYSYSNFGYCVLGRVVEHFIAKPYDQACQELVFAPLSLNSLAIGQSKLEAALPGEVQYFGERAYNHDQAVMDAHGGWVSTASDLARFADAFSDRDDSPLLSASSIDQMWSRPTPSESDATTSPTWYGLGWSLRRTSSGKLNAWHNGRLWDGTSSIMVRRHDGYCWAVLFNYDRSATDNRSLASHFDRGIHQTVDRVQNWQRRLSPKKRETHSGVVIIGEQNIPYRLVLPVGFDSESTSDKRHPLVLFLHGSGERGDDNRLQMGHFPQRLSRDLREVSADAFALVPQCPKNQSWSTFERGLGFRLDLDSPPSVAAQGAMAALHEVVAEYPIDSNRIAVTGLSLGGFGSWELAARFPDVFSALVPVCGGGSPRAAARYAGIPVQVWHGDADSVVPVQFSQRMAEALDGLGLDVDYRELEGVQHNAWTAAYSHADCHALLFESQRNEGEATRAVVGTLARALPEHERIAFLGDSITQAGNRPGGYVDLIRSGLQDAGVATTIIPAGISGHKVPDLLKRFQADVVDQRATLVFIYIGINDVWHSLRDRGTPVEEFEAGLRELVQTLKASGASVVLATPSVIGEQPFGENQLDVKLKQYAEVSRRVALEEGAVLCDLARAFAELLAVRNPQGLGKGVLTGDGVHLNTMGNHLVAREAARSLRRAVITRPKVDADSTSEQADD